MITCNTLRNYTVKHDYVNLQGADNELVTYADYMMFNLLTYWLHASLYLLVLLFNWNIQTHVSIWYPSLKSCKIQKRQNSVYFKVLEYF